MSRFMMFCQIIAPHLQLYKKVLLRGGDGETYVQHRGQRQRVFEDSFIVFISNSCLDHSQPGCTEVSWCVKARSLRLSRVLWPGGASLSPLQESSAAPSRVYMYINAIGYCLYRHRLPRCLFTSTLGSPRLRLILARDSPRSV